MNKQLQWFVNGTNGERVVTTVNTDAGKAGKPLVVKAQSGVTYELKDPLKGVAPDQMLVRRRKNDLEIVLAVEGRAEERDAPADIIVEDYFKADSTRLVGLAEDGQYYTYVPQEGEASLLSWNLANEAYSYHSLGYSDASALPWWPLLLGGLLLGAGGGGSSSAPTRKPPVVVITEDANNDGTISKEELNGQVDVRVTLPADAKVGETLVVRDNQGNTQQIVLTQPDIDRGTVDVTFPPPSAGTTLVVEAEVKDTGGNPGPKGQDTAILPSVEVVDGPSVPSPPPPSPPPPVPPAPAPEPVPAPPAPAPVITVNAPDNTPDTTPTITGTTDQPPGSTVTVTITDSTGTPQTITTTVQPGGTYTVTPTTPLPEGPYTVVATVTNPAGIPGTATDPGSIDITPPLVTVNAPDNTPDTTPTITGTTDQPVGSTVTVTITDSTGTPQTITTTVQPGGTYEVTPTTPLPEGSYTATATVTDPAGNVATATDPGSIDTTAPLVTVDAPDNTEDKTPAITGTTDQPVGSTVTVTITDSTGTPQTITTTVQPGGTYEVTPTIPLVEGPYTAVATVTDPAGNVGTATDPGSIDTLPLAQADEASIAE
ncbi:Ig-like domain-containing protein, partial [Hydrogenophaga sp. OTU3427]|uniref:Ig-like domain-containing protein n=1 Tax=Hydrogenophaga sp. OTU3427 TaxID=3043856 RepID=UPI00313A8757